MSSLIATATETLAPQALAKEAGLLLRAGRPDEADALFREVLETDPAHPRALIGRVTAARRRGAAATILERCEAALAHLPDRTDLRCHAAEALLSLGRLAEAQGHVATLLELDTEGPDTLCAAAALAREMKDHEGVIRHGEAALALKPGHWRLALDCANALEALGRDADALRHYERAAAIRPGHAKTLIRLSDACRALGRHAAAEEALRQALAAHPRNTTVMLRLGRLSQSMGRTGPAREMFERACRTDPRQPEPWLHLARLAGQTSSFADALEILEAGRRSVGETVPMLLAEAGLLQGHGLAREAEKCLALAEALDPRDGEVRRKRLDTDIAEGRFAQAEAAVDRLPGATPAERAHRHRLLGQIAAARRDHAAARDCFENALAEDGRSAEAHEGLARARLFLRQPEPARASLVAARRLQARELRARGRSTAPLRGVLGEMINEARIAGPGPASEELDGLLRAHRAAPGLTSLAIAILDRLRRDARLDPRPGGGDLRIPRLLHQYWDRPSLPPDVAELMRSWRLENPGWGYRRHDKASARAYLLDRGMTEAARAFALARQPAQQADLFRLAVLQAEGGVYADADDRCTGPLDEALGGPAFLSWQEALGSVGNNFIAVVPGHAVISAALEQAVEAVLRGDAETMWMSTGPGLLSRALVQHLAEDERRLETLGREIVILERWNLRRFCASHCKASYKLGGKHWFMREMALQPK